METCLFIIWSGVVICVTGGGLDNTKQNNVTQKWGFMSFVLLVCVCVGGGGLDNTKQNDVCDSEVGFYVICVIIGGLNSTKHCHYICVFNMGVWMGYND